ncbi:MAG: glycosyltransferase [Phycisphaerae bacterium]|nr:glycosyltransferase [Phycisphaerae bacterium]
MNAAPTNLAALRALVAQGHAAQAAEAAERWLAGRPGTPACAAEAVMLAEAAQIAGQVDRAAALLSAACAMNPADAGPAALAARFLGQQGRYMDVCKVCAAALQRRPHHPELTVHFANALRWLTRTREAAEVYRRALAACPDDPGLTMNYATTLDYLPEADPLRTLVAHKHAAAVARRRAGAALPPPGQRRPGPWRIGFVSGDLRRHSVAGFIEPVLRALGSRGVETACYHVAAAEDGVSRRLAGLAARWRLAPHLDHRALADMIRRDDVDLLVDLSGLSANNRLGTMALRPARRQATYLGYPNTTGLDEIGHRVVDAVTDPPGAEERAVERLARVEGCFLAWAPPDGAPEVTPPPCLATGRITFGSFNSSLKLNEPVIALWADIVNAVRGSRLLLKPSGAMDAPSLRAVADRFAAAGLGADRLEVLAFEPDERAHLAAYGRVDIALDPWPYNGTATTVEALWMGVPVVTMAGATHAGRVGLSLLGAAGLARLAATDATGYAAIAAGLAMRPEVLAELRAGMRARVSGGPLGDGSRVAAVLEGLARSDG